MKKYILLAAFLSTTAWAAGKLQNADFATPAQITGAGGSISQLVNTSNMYDNVNAQLLNTTLAAKISNPMTTAEDLIKGGVAGAPIRLAVGANGTCLTVTAGVVGWTACSGSSPLTTKGDLYTYAAADARLPVGANGTILSANSAQATGLEWVTPTDTGITQLTGDVTAGPGNGSQAATIANLAVTNAKIANSTIDLTAKVTGVLPVANGGTGAYTLADAGVLIGNGAGVVQVTAAGTAGDVLTSNGVGVDPTFQTPAAAGITQLTGDVTAGPGSGSQATTIANLAVTNAKIANSTIDLTAKVTGILPVANGGTGLSGGTSGGIPYYSGAGAITSSGALSQYQVILGGGAGGAPNVVSGTGTSGQVLTSNGAGTNPTWQAAGGGGSSSEGLPAYANSQIETSTGLFTFTVPAGVYKLAVLVVGAGSGGGGGDTLSGAGGGAGGCVIYTRDYAVTPGAVIRGQVGVGGTAGTGVNDGASGGGNSLVTASSASAFGSLLAPMGMVAGGASGGAPGTVGCHGAGNGGTGNSGLGGGNAIYTPDFFSGITANLISYGGHWNGGASAGTNWSTRLGGGGAGAGGVGGNAVAATNGGNGGTGVAVDIDGTTRYFAGGGGGGSYNTSVAAGTGGTGGGGAGGQDANGTAGTANTGGGGGGAGGGPTNGSTIRNGGAGGSGTVEIYWD